MGKHVLATMFTTTSYGTWLPGDARGYVEDGKILPATPRLHDHAQRLQSGEAVFFTPAKPGENLIIDPNYLYFRDMNIVTSYSCGPDDTRKSLELIKQGIVTAKKLVTHRFSIDETEKAYRTVAEAKESLKVLITL